MSSRTSAACRDCARGRGERQASREGQLRHDRADRDWRERDVQSRAGLFDRGDLRDESHRQGRGWAAGENRPDGWLARAGRNHDRGRGVWFSRAREYRRRAANVGVHDRAVADRDRPARGASERHDHPALRGVSRRASLHSPAGPRDQNRGDREDVAPLTQPQTCRRAAQLTVQSWALNEDVSGLPGGQPRGRDGQGRAAPGSGERSGCAHKRQTDQESHGEHRGPCRTQVPEVGDAARADTHPRTLSHEFPLERPSRRRGWRSRSHGTCSHITVLDAHAHTRTAATRRAPDGRAAHLMRRQEVAVTRTRSPVIPGKQGLRACRGGRKRSRVASSSVKAHRSDHEEVEVAVAGDCVYVLVGTSSRSG